MKRVFKIIPLKDRDMFKEFMIENFNYKYSLDIIDDYCNNISYENKKQMTNSSVFNLFLIRCSLLNLIKRWINKINKIFN